MTNVNRTVLVVTSEFPPMPGGIGNHAYNLCVQLVQKGYDVSVLTNKRAESDVHFEEFKMANPALRVIALERSANPIITYFNRITSFRKLLLQQPAHVIYSGKFSIWLAALGWHKGDGWGVIHGSEIKQSGLKRWWFQRGLFKLKGLISVSGFTQEVLLKEYPDVNNNRCYVINNGFELEEYPLIQRVVLPEECRIITVGGMHRRKGQHNIISALPTLVKHFPKIQYTIAGLPETMPALQGLARALGVEAHVQFVPNPSRAELVNLLQQAQIFGMLSENLSNGDIEGFGIAILEGMSLGLPAIGSKHSGIRDAIDDQRTGVLIEDIHNANEIASALHKILGNYSDYSSQALQWSERFRWSAVITQYLKVIETT